MVPIVGVGVGAPGDEGSTWIVVLDEGQDVDEVAGDHSVVIEQRYERLFNGFSAQVTSTQLTSLQEDDRIASISADRVFSRQQQGGPTPVTQLSSWGQDRMGLLESPTANVDNRDKKLDVDIAIFDTGIDPNHPDLRVAGGVDCANAGTWQDEQGHGTFVAGIAAGLDNRFGIVGVAPGTRLWSVRIENSGGTIYESYLLCGLEWVLEQNGAIRVVNMSL